MPTTVISGQMKLKERLPKIQLGFFLELSVNLLKLKTEYRTFDFRLSKQKLNWKIFSFNSCGVKSGIIDKRWLQNSPYFCLLKNARAVKQKVWNEAENRERDP